MSRNMGKCPLYSPLCFPEAVVRNSNSLLYESPKFLHRQQFDWFYNFITSPIDKFRIAKHGIHKFIVPCRCLGHNKSPSPWFQSLVCSTIHSVLYNCACLIKNIVAIAPWIKNFFYRASQFLQSWKISIMCCSAARQLPHSLNWI